MAAARSKGESGVKRYEHRHLHQRRQEAACRAADQTRDLGEIERVDLLLRRSGCAPAAASTVTIMITALDQSVQCATEPV
jgi:hypothetical protein